MKKYEYEIVSLTGENTVPEVLYEELNRWGAAGFAPAFTLQLPNQGGAILLVKESESQSFEDVVQARSRS